MKPRLRIMADHRPSVDQPALTVRELINLFGSVSALAEAAGVSRQAVWQWKNIPPARCPRIANASKGKVTVHHLRPDVFGSTDQQIQHITHGAASPIYRAIELFGSQSALANACGVTHQSVLKWIKYRIPAERCIDIERATCGQVSRSDLRPDLWPAPYKAA